MKRNDATSEDRSFRLTASMKAWLCSVLILAGLVAVAASCTEVETVGQQREFLVNPMTDAMTKAPVAGTTFPTTRSIAIAAHHFENGSWADRWFTGVTFNYVAADGYWHASPPKYYPFTGELLLVGFSKENLAGTLTFPWAGEEGDAAVGKAKILYVMPDNSTVQDDILYSAGNSTNGSTVQNPANMVFSHAQAQVAFTAETSLAYDAATNYGFTINSIELLPMSYSGTFHARERRSNGITSDFWSDLGEAAAKSIPGLSTPLNLVTSGSAVAVGEGMLMPPQPFPGFVLTYVFHNGFDGDGTTPLNKTLSMTWTPEAGTGMILPQGTKTVFAMTFSPTEILVSPTLVDWVVPAATAVSAASFGASVQSPTAAGTGNRMDLTNGHIDAVTTDFNITSGTFRIRSSATGSYVSMTVSSRGANWAVLTSTVGTVNLYAVSGGWVADFTPASSGD